MKDEAGKQARSSAKVNVEKATFSNTMAPSYAEKLPDIRFCAYALVCTESWLSHRVSASNVDS